MNDASGSFSDGSGTANYANNANCQWMIAPPGATRITLRFPEFSTQTRVDFVRVYQCTDVYCSQQQQLAELSGRYPVVQGLTSTPGFVKVVFTADGSVGFDGFTASWSTVYSCVYVCVHMYVYMFHVYVCVYHQGGLHVRWQRQLRWVYCILEQGIYVYTYVHMHV
jgi:hypothetical protein